VIALLVALLAQAAGPGVPGPAVSPPPGHRPARVPDPLLLQAAAAGDPPLEALRAAATSLTLAEPARARSLLERARWAAWLPEVRVRADQRLGRAESLDLGKSPLDAPVTPVGVDTTNDVRYEVRATWDLSRIVFNPDEVAASAQALRMADVRREIESLVIRLFFERRRLKAEALASDSSDRASSFQLGLRIQEIEAELDALTGGAFARLRGLRAGDSPLAVP
jgi:hypothetical protein